MMHYTDSMRFFSGRSVSLVFLAVLLSGTAWFIYGHLYPTVVYKTPPVPTEEPLTSQGAGIEPEQSENSRSAIAELPPRVFIQVPFASQAPFGDWGMPYQEACEEASLILVHYYLEQKALTPAEADAEIRRMAEYEVNELGFHADTTAEETAIVAQKFYGHKATVYYDITINDIKKQIAAGNPVIVPLAGRDIGNPYYSGLGPWYHMLVIVGYDSKNFITNDVGTKRGEGYKYPQQVLYDAIHNWTGAKEDIRNGRKAMLVVTR